jgi:hypothetical protein
MRSFFKAVSARTPSAVAAATLAVAFAAGSTLSAGQPATGVNANRDSWRANLRSHAQPPRPGAAAPQPAGGSVEYRSLDGSNNNRAKPQWGSANTNYLREASGAAYADGKSAPAGASRPSVRAISNALCDQGDVETADERGLSTAVYEFGQFLDHDIGLAKGGFSEAFDIAVPKGDPWFDPAGTGTKVIWFDRSAFDAATGITNARQQINTVSSFIDASQIYGTDAARADWLRTKSGGRLKVRSTPQGDMLPLNDGTMANDDPLGQNPTTLVVAGDVRANEQPGLTTFHTIFLREHNRQADRLKALNPAWSDERLYQEARRLVIAMLQRITYEEFLPAVLGRPMPPYRGYRADVNPGLSNVFAAAAYRIGHSMVGPDIGVTNEQFEEVDSLNLASVFFNPGVLASVGGVDPFVRYFAITTHQRVDTQIVGQLRNFLFGPPGAGGFDLAALNIQRGRDHGLGDYNTVRKDFGLPKVRSFPQITSKPALAAKLQALYTSVDNIDPWIGMLAEDHLPGASVGPTHAAVLMDQFLRLRDGDRFWYRNGQFNPREAAVIEASTLSEILRRNTSVARLQPHVFFAADLAADHCPADFDANGVVDHRDYLAFLAAYTARNASADLDHNGVVDADDLAKFLTDFFAGC